jgi:hypothetical protein
LELPIHPPRVKSRNESAFTLNPFTIPPSKTFIYIFRSNE